MLIPPTAFWPAVFTSYTIPGFLILNIFLLLIAPFFKWKLSIFPLLGLLFGIPFLLISYSYKGDIVSGNYDLSILSYNTRFFRTSNTYSEFSEEMISWVSNDSSDIKCIQEYCTNSNYQDLNVTQQITKNGYMSFVFVTQGNDSDHDQGLAIFSKYPIIETGYVWKDSASHNAGLYADINFKHNNVRIYNVHLESMGLQLSQYKSTDQYDSKLKGLASKLKKGAEKRSIQIEKLIDHTTKCPYPYIICGDFNDTPYSYNYFKLNFFFTNAFEEAGNGFGFTFNSILFFLRIDHQFYNSKIEALNYRIDRTIKASDHFPTRGFYNIR